MAPPHPPPAGRRATPSGRRRTNLALLVLVPLAVLTGLWANTIGTNALIHPSVIHGMVAMAILVLAPWKSAIVRSGLGKRRPSSWVSLLLLLLIAITLVSGLAHAIGYTGRIGPLILMQVHIGGAVGALILVFIHYRSHPVRLHRIDMGRRSFLRFASLSGAAAALWLVGEGALDAVGLSGGRRRFTGSHERGSFTPQLMPVTSWLDDPVQHINPDEWAVNIAGRNLTLAQVEALPMDRFDAVLDCTSAWHTNQSWSGVRLDHLIDPGEARSVAVRSQTGYGRRFPVDDIENLWLVTRVGGEPLSAGHGFPARIVAPGRRGFWWVKWVVSIEVSPLPWWLQPPFPLT